MKPNIFSSNSKKFIIISLIMAMSLPGFARKERDAVPKDKISAIINAHMHEEGFEVVKVGLLGTTAIKSFVRLAGDEYADEESRQYLDIIKGVKRIAIVDYEDCLPEVRSRISSKLQKALKHTSLLMEVKDGDDTMHLYGVMSEDSSAIKDFVLFSSEDCALICLFGSIPIDAMMKLAQER